MFLNLEKDYIALDPDTLLDGQFINESIKLTPGGPKIINNLTTVQLSELKLNVFDIVSLTILKHF